MPCRQFPPPNIANTKMAHIDSINEKATFFLYFPQPCHTRPAHSKDRRVYPQSSNEPQSLIPELLKWASKQPLFRMPSTTSNSPEK